jgi:hypothetical protein
VLPTKLNSYLNEIEVIQAPAEVVEVVEDFDEAVAQEVPKERKKAKPKPERERSRPKPPMPEAKGNAKKSTTGREEAAPKQNNDIFSSFNVSLKEIQKGIAAHAREQSGNSAPHDSSKTVASALLTSHSSDYSD